MRATNYARATYQEIYDVMTRDGMVSVFGFHTPVGDGPYQMLHGFFTQFRKYKYSGMKVNIIPAAQLPADPLQISYEAGTESYIDPRDLQNPVLFHGAHGNNLGDVLNMIYANNGLKWSEGSINAIEKASNTGDGWTFEQWYNASMLDPSFRKYNVMNNMSLPFMSPRVHPLMSDLAIQPAFESVSDFDVEYPQIKAVPADVDGADINDAYLGDIIPHIPYSNSSGTRLSMGVPINIMANRLTKLGWMDTFTWTKANTSSGTGSNAQEVTVSPLPKIMMGALIMPPSYRTKLAFRIVISHFFEFARFNTSITPTTINRATPSLAGQATFNYHNFLPDELTSSASLSETDTIDSINGDVRQSVSGVL